jgi:hypothetical protein
VDICALCVATAVLGLSGQLLRGIKLPVLARLVLHDQYAQRVSFDCPAADRDAGCPTYRGTYTVLQLKLNGT